MKETAYDMLYLSTCAVNGIVPDKDRVAHIDLEKLFQTCQFHSLTAIVCMALESAGVADKKFIEAKSKAIRKNIMLDAEREKICEFLEENGIWYMPLKGIILKELYPKIGMRQMSDNDILFDESYRKDVMQLMKNNGYHLKGDNGVHCDEWLKEPVYNFEMHLNLFVENREVFYHYYKNIKERLQKVNGKNYERLFSDEDFYIYMTAHAYKHYSIGGTGLRSLLDCFVFLKEKGDLLNWEYIAKQTDILEITDFEQKSRKLSMKIFTNPDFEKLSAEEKQMLEFYLFSGTYGTMKNAVNKRFRTFTEQTGSTSKFGYIMHRIFPPMEFYKQYFPFFYQHKILLPIGWGFRLVRGVIFRRKRIKSEMYFLHNLDDSE